MEGGREGGGSRSVLCSEIDKSGRRRPGSSRAGGGKCPVVLTGGESGRCLLSSRGRAQSFRPGAWLDHKTFTTQRFVLVCGI